MHRARTDRRDDGAAPGTEGRSVDTPHGRSGSARIQVSSRVARPDPKDVRPKGVPMNVSDAILIAEGVRKVYRSGGDEVVALHGLDLEVGRGEFVAVMG